MHNGSATLAYGELLDGAKVIVFTVLMPGTPFSSKDLSLNPESLPRPLEKGPPPQALCTISSCFISFMVFNTVGSYLAYSFIGVFIINLPHKLQALWYRDLVCFVPCCIPSALHVARHIIGAQEMLVE